LDPNASVTREVRRVARSRLDDAIEILESLDEASADEIEDAVHDVRKRCKEVRALGRLVRSSIGDEFERVNDTVREAADCLASIRDAHAVLATLDDLRAATHGSGEADLAAVRVAQAAAADQATRDVHSGDERIEHADELLVAARKRIKHWNVPDDFASLGTGIETAYRRGRTALRRARERPTDERLHEWRKSVKHLWYQLRLIEPAAPSALEPIVDTLDDLAEALGDDHDLAVLVERLANDPARFGGSQHVMRAIDLARTQQDDLRRRAFRLGATIYAEKPTAFVKRIEVYWSCTVREGPELATGGIADLAVEERRTAAAEKARDTTRTVERERKYLVAVPPSLPDDGVEVRQGYLALDGIVSVRVRESAGEGSTLTVTAGRGAVRTELSWPISDEQFAAMWEQTRGRRIRKTRYRLPLNGHDIEVHMFHDDLAGLALAEVEFESDHDMETFEPPAWFGREVTGDIAFTNASLAANAPRGQPAA
jgi:CYTH domain-containing protein/CHAD domain-containing protein